MSHRSSPQKSQRDASPTLVLTSEASKSIAAESPNASPTTAEESPSRPDETPSARPLETPSKTPFEEVPFRNVDYKSMTLEDLIQRSARRVKIGPNGEEIHDTTWMEVKLKLNSRAASARKSFLEEKTNPISTDIVTDLKGDFEAAIESSAGESSPKASEQLKNSQETREQTSPKEEKSVQAGEKQKTDITPTPSQPGFVPRRSARLAEKRARRTSPSKSSVQKRKRQSSKSQSMKKSKQG